MTRFFLFILLLSTSLVGCGDNTNEDKVEIKDISRSGSIESQMTTLHLPDNRDVLMTTHKVWKNGVLEREIVHTDTIPSLGSGALEAADASGNLTHTTGPKDYEFYITVK